MELFLRFQRGRSDMERNNFEVLKERVLELSESSIWEIAVTEWEISNCEEDENCSSQCVCGQTNLKYLFTIHNFKNNNELYYIGSTCIKRFGREDLSSETDVIEKLFVLRHAIEKNKYIELNSTFFSRKLLEYLFNKGAFLPTKYNDYNGEKDYLFMLDMFNKHTWSENQQRKITAVILNSIKPYLVKNMKEHRKEKKQYADS